MIEKMKTQETNAKEKLKIPNFGEVKIIASNKNALKCVDPRLFKEFSPEQNALSILSEHRNRMPENYESAVAVPGGSLGYAMILMGAFTDITTGKTEITAQQAVDFIIKWHEKEGIPPSYHTDNQGHGFGCGHVRLASQKENEKLYRVNSDNVKKILDYTEEKVDRGSIEAVETILKGPHGEKGVLKTKGGKTVKQTDDRGNEFFRLDATQHEENLESLALFVIENAGEVTGREIDITAERLTEKFNEVSDMQTNATLGLLAAALKKELPIFETDFNKENPTFEEIGKVLPILQKA